MNPELEWWLAFTLYFELQFEAYHPSYQEPWTGLNICDGPLLPAMKLESDP